MNECYINNMDKLVQINELELYVSTWIDFKNIMLIKKSKLQGLPWWSSG